MQFDSCHGTTFLDFEDVKVPRANLIGEEGLVVSGIQRHNKRLVLVTQLEDLLVQDAENISSNMTCHL